MAQCEQVTSGSANNQLLYFTSSSVFADKSGMMFISDASGTPNLWMLDFASGAQRQLTFQDEGYLRSYVYFDGLTERGFGKASVSLDAERKAAYFLQGRALCRVDAQGNLDELNRLLSGQMTGFTHVSSDGTLLCVPTVDADAFEVTGDRAVEIDRRVQMHNLSSYLHIFETATGREIACERIPRAWITHVQFRPNGTEILYNHEWCSDCGIRRMWYFDGRTHRPLRTEEQGRSRKDWTCHEMWQDDGRFVIYHGQYRDGQAYIGRVDITSGEIIEIPIDRAYTAYGHFTVRKSGMLVTDGYWREPEDLAGAEKGHWISTLRPDWERRTIEWQPRCLHQSSWDCQCSHPHPIFDEDEEFVYFTSDRTGKRQIYRLPV